MKQPVADGVSAHAQESGGCRVLGRVAVNESLGAMRRLTVEVPGWRGARPGQFALLQAEPSRCFLGRALSVSDESEQKVSFLVAPIGEGTRELGSLAVDDAVWVVGPLGNGFDIAVLAGGPGRTVVVGGGVGVAPFPLLLTRLGERLLGAKRKPGDTGRDGQMGADHEVLVLAGFRDAEQAKGVGPLQEAGARMGEAGLPCRLEVATEDGSRGPAEKVTDLLARHLRAGDLVVACGPEAMARGVWRICCRVPRVGAWFSLEANMACGVGSCHGCALKLADGSYARVCRDGPVFAGKEVFGE